VVHPKGAPPMILRCILGPDSVIKILSEEELSKHNGKDDEPFIWIGCNGKVYDVTTSYHWRGGRHHALHPAGRDLTAATEKSLHRVDLLGRFPVVGFLKELE
jgi:predicted heme/steroid binding protein